MSKRTISLSSKVKEDPSPVFCDVCGDVLYQLAPLGTLVLNPEISRQYGSAAHATVSLRLGENDIDGGAGEDTTFTLCPRCFIQTIQTQLELAGALPKITPWVE